MLEHRSSIENLHDVLQCTAAIYVAHAAAPPSEEADDVMQHGVDGKNNTSLSIFLAKLCQYHYLNIIHDIYLIYTYFLTLGLSHLMYEWLDMH